ncbi:unnamed protein product [Rhizoctonia solani]|uniref:Uncharacterized protein n=1 Tax=Rhizoctonia solani TaxID=456999 RepID=A0A8H3GMV5_9AGAM|nr:unnamed protein product [Rhizoctonia solani]
MLNSGQDGASTGHAGMVPSGEPYVQPRSASRMSSTQEPPLESMPRPPRSNKTGRSSAHIYVIQSNTSRPSSRALAASSRIGGMEGGSVKDASKGSSHPITGNEGSEEEEIREVEEGNDAYMEANTGAMQIEVPTEIPSNSYQTMSGPRALVGWKQPLQVPCASPVLAPPAQIMGLTLVQLIPPLPAPQTNPLINKPSKTGKIKQERKDKPSPSAKANTRQWNCCHTSTAQKNEPGPLVVQILPNLDNQPPVIRIIGGKGKEKEQKGDKPQGTPNPLEQTRLDYEVIDAIGKNKEQLAALLDYEESMGNGGRKARILFVNTNKDETEPVKDKGKTPSTPKNKYRGHATLGVSMNQLEGERKPAHTPAPNTVASKNRGLPTGGYLHDRLTNTTKRATAAGGDPNDSSNLSSSSDSEDDDFNNMNPRELARYIKKLKKNNKERKEKEKLQKLQLSGFKTKLPTTYNGSSNFDTFEQFVYEVETWQEDTGFEDYEAIRHVKSFLKDKAANYYMVYSIIAFRQTVRQEFAVNSTP